MRSAFVRLTSLLLVLVLSLSVLLTPAAAAEQTDGVITKEESIYGTLTASGEVTGLYVVNAFDLPAGSAFTDRGDYLQVKNLTDLSELSYKNGQVTGVSEGERFYYQGDLRSTRLPWVIQIEYLLDGQPITPEELGGKTGRVTIHLTTCADDDFGSVFYDNLVLQISMTLDAGRCSNFEGENATVASVGSSKQATFMVLPGKEGDLSLSFDARDFEMAGMTIAAVPLSIAFDLPDTGEMEDGLGQLTDAVAQLNDGAARLNEGVGDLHAGVRQLKQGAQALEEGTGALADGSEQFTDGLSQLDQNSAELIEGSAQIKQALETVSEGFSQMPELPEEAEKLLDSLSDLPPALRKLAQSLEQAAEQVPQLPEELQEAIGQLKKLAEELSDLELSQQELEALKQAVLENEVAAKALEKLLANQEAAELISQIYKELEAHSDQIEAALDQIAENGLLNTIAEQLRELADKLEEADLAGSLDQLAQLGPGMALLSDNYGQFHDGLVQYTDGVGMLSDNYSELNGGIQTLDDGVGQLADGIAALADGTGELAEGTEQLADGTHQMHIETKDIPETMRDEIDALLAEYDFGGFEMVSFTDSANDGVEMIQFALTTEKIQVPEEPVLQAPEEETLTFWEKLLSLFGL